MKTISDPFIKPLDLLQSLIATQEFILRKTAQTAHALEIEFLFESCLPLFRETGVGVRDRYFFPLCDVSNCVDGFFAFVPVPGVLAIRQARMIDPGGYRKDPALRSFRP